MKKITLLTMCLAILLGVSCKKKDDRYPYADFKVNGVHKKYENSDNFSTSSCGASTWCGHFTQQGLVFTKNYFKIGIPGNPVVGQTYSSGETGFVVRYRNENETEYELTVTPMTVTFSKWEGSGGWAEGNFSGWLKSAAGDSVQIQDGYFQNQIQ
ncbi:MAG: hypothetical protein V1733_07920 [bacterium]